MALPDDSKDPWPPKGAAPAMALMREWGAWWSGDPAKLMEFYGTGMGGQLAPAGPARRWWRFWDRGSRGNNPAARQRAQLHVPLAGDMAATSAALLFSEAPEIEIPEAHAQAANSDATAAEERLDEILEEGGFTNRLLEAADFAAGLGGVYLKPAWDKDVADYPLLAVVQPDQVLPEFRFGILRAATLWRIVEEADRDVLRHVERHEVGPDGRGVILHGLYRGNGDELGTRLSDEEMTAKTGLMPSLVLPFTGIGIRYVPNMRPNRRLRGSPLGQADYAGAEGLLDALDESWASWIRDIRLAKARIVVPRDMLDTKGQFDVDHEIYTPLDTPGDTEDKGLASNVSLLQAAIRVDEHSKTCMSLIERIVDHGGYAPQTFGIGIEGRAETGTALNIRERKTFLTQQRKGAWYGAAIADIGEMFLAIDREQFSSGVTVFRPRVTLSDSIAPDERQVAETVELWSRAKAASIEVRVQAVHPDWDQEDVTTEVLRIQAEQGLVVAPPDLPA